MEAYTQTSFNGRTGARPFSEVSRNLTNRLAQYAPLETAITRDGIYRVLDRAKTPLRLGIGALETLKQLINYSWAHDWEEGSEPIVWPSNDTLAEDAGVTITAIQARLRSLRALGLIQMRDSSNGKRRGRRDSKGRIVSAFGIDLSPLRIRADELIALGDARSGQKLLFKRGKDAISAVRRMVAQALAQAADMNLTGPHWIALQQRIEQIGRAASAARSMRDSDAYEQALDRLPSLETLVGETVDRFLFLKKETPTDTEIAVHIQIQTKPSPESVLARRRSSSIDSEPMSLQPQVSVSGKKSEIKTSPAELLRMFPTTAMYVRAEELRAGDGSNPQWSKLHRAAEALVNTLGIRRGTWIDALGILGHDQATIAVMITAERESLDEIRFTAGKYFSGMVTRAQKGELDLAKSLWGFRTVGMTQQ
jgi:replication initiation protein RepC